MGANLSVLISHHSNNKKNKLTYKEKNNNKNSNNNNRIISIDNYDNFCGHQNNNINNISTNIEGINNHQILNENGDQHHHISPTKLNNNNNNNNNLKDITKYTFHNWKCISEADLQDGTEKPPSCRYAHTMTATDSNIYIFGGYNGVYLNDVHCFDTINKKWCLINTIGTPPIKRAFHSSWVWNKKLYIYAGFNGKLILNDLYSLDIENGMEWKLEITNGLQPKPRFEHTTSLIGNSIYLFGGANDSNWLSDIHILNLENNQWRSITSSMVQGDCPPKRCAHSSCVVGNSIFIFGGYDGSLRLNSIYEFDTIKKRWFNLQSHNNKKMGRAAHSCSAFDSSGSGNNSNMISFGGFEGTKRLNDLSIFNTVHKEWRPTIITGNPPSIRSYHSSAVIGNKMYIFGGFGEFNRLNDLFILEQYFPTLSDICILQLLILSKKENDDNSSHNNNNNSNNNNNNNNNNGDNNDSNNSNNKYINRSIELLKNSHSQIGEQINNMNLIKFWWSD